MRSISLEAVASELPEQVVDNGFFAHATAQRRGMFTAPRTRRHVARDESATLLIERASRRLIERARLDLAGTNLRVDPHLGHG